MLFITQLQAKLKLYELELKDCNIPQNMTKESVNILYKELLTQTVNLEWNSLLPLIFMLENRLVELAK